MLDEVETWQTRPLDASSARSCTSTPWWIKVRDGQRGPQRHASTTSPSGSTPGRSRARARHLGAVHRGWRQVLGRGRRRAAQPRSCVTSSSPAATSAADRRSPRRSRPTFPLGRRPDLRRAPHPRRRSGPCPPRRPQEGLRRPAPDLHRHHPDAAQPTLLARRRLPAGPHATPPPSRPGRHAWQRFIPFLRLPARAAPHHRRQRRGEPELPAPPDRRSRDTSRTTTPRSSCCRWPSATSKTNAPTSAKEKGLPPTQRTAPGRLVEGATVQGWKAALGALALAYPDRLAGHLLTAFLRHGHPSRRAGGVHVERRAQRGRNVTPTRSSRSGRRRRKSTPLADSLTQT